MLSRYSYQFFTSFFLVTAFIFAIISHTIFSRGLSYDGVLNLKGMILHNSFYFNETSRLFFHFLYQLPARLFIAFSSSDSLSLLSQIFSFGLIWIHIFSVVGCWLILPKDKKDYIFFPFFAFLVGPLTALDHSISISLSVFSYVWFVAFTIYYSDFSLKRHKVLFVLAPFPLLLSHELMSYTSFFLIFLCILKNNYQKTFMNKVILTNLILFFIFIFFTAVYFIIFPNNPNNRNDFLSGLLSLKFLYSGKALHLYIMSAFILIIIPFFQLFRSSILKWLLLTYFGFMSLTVNAMLFFFGLDNFLYQIHPDYFYPYPANCNRVWVCLILPVTLLLWFFV